MPTLGETPPVTRVFEADKTSTKTKKSRPICQRIGRLLWRNFLVLGLVFFVVFGFLFPAPGAYLDGLPTITIAISVIFFISGLKLKTNEVKNAFKVWRATLFGIVSILFITPLMAFVLVDLPLNVPNEFLVGIAIFCVTPTTLTSGVILTKEAYGNIALALTFTVITNFIAVFTVPVTMPLVFRISSVDASAVKLETTDLLMQLALTILLPLIAGKCLHDFSLRVRKLVKSNPKILKLISCCLLFLIPWTKISTSVEDLKLVSPANLFLAMALGLVVHMVYLVFNYVIATILKIPLPEKKAVVIMCSEKTLPVAFTIVGILPEDGALSIGLISIPIITSHFFQLMTDAVVAQHWANLYEVELEKENARRVEDEIYECVVGKQSFSNGLAVNAWDGPSRYPTRGTGTSFSTPMSVSPDISTTDILLRRSGSCATGKKRSCMGSNLTADTCDTPTRNSTTRPCARRTGTNFSTISVSPDISTREILLSATDILLMRDGTDGEREMQAVSAKKRLSSSVSFDPTPLLRTSFSKSTGK